MPHNDGEKDAGTRGRRKKWHKSGDTHSYGETRKQDENKFEIRRSVEFSSATERCISWRVDGRSHAAEEESGDVDRLLIKQLWRNQQHPVHQTTREVHKLKEKNGHIIYICPATVHHMDAAFSIDRKIYERDPDDPWMTRTRVWLFWGIFLNATLRAAVHLGQDHEANLRYVKDNLWNSVGQLFHITGVSTWVSKRCHVDVDKLIVWKGLSDHQRQNLRLLRLCALCWKNGRWPYCENNHFKELNRIDGMPTEFEWKLFPGITALGLLKKIQHLMRDLQCEPEHFKDKIIFLSMYDDIEWGAKGNKEKCEYNSQTVTNYARRFPVIGLSWGLDQKKSGTKLTLTNSTEHGINLQRTRRQISQDPVIQYFVPPVPLREENYEVKEEARSQYTSTVVMKTSSCFSARWFLRTSSVSTEQYKTHATKYPKVLGLRWNLQHLIIWKRWKFLPTSLLQKILPMHSNGETSCKKTSAKIEHLPEDQKLSKPCSDTGFVERGQYFYTLQTVEGQQMQHLCREYTMPRNEKGTRKRGWILKNTRIGPVLNIKVCYHDDRYSIENQVHFKTIPFLGSESCMALISTWQNRCRPRKKKKHSFGETHC